MEDKIYPGVSSRVKAIVTDSIVILFLLVLVSYILSAFSEVPDVVRIGIFVFIFLLYDPIFTSSFGATIGHFVFGIRVRRANNETQNIIFPLALLRYTIKMALGWISLLTVSGNAKGKAIHDMAAASVVVYK